MCQNNCTGDIGARRMTGTIFDDRTKEPRLPDAGATAVTCALDKGNVFTSVICPRFVKTGLIGRCHAVMSTNLRARPEPSNKQGPSLSELLTFNKAI